MFGTQFAADATRRRARAARRRVRRPHRRRRRRGHRARGRPRARRRVPAARGSRARRAGGRGRLLRRLDVGGAGARGRGRLRRRRRQLGRPGGAPPRPLRAPGDDPRARRVARGEHVAVPDRRDRRRAERRGPVRGPRSPRVQGDGRLERLELLRNASAARPRRCGRRALRPDRRGRPHTEWLPTRSSATSGATSSPAPSAGLRADVRDERARRVRGRRRARRRR